MLSRFEFDRERALSELSEYGIGFQKGVPTERKRSRSLTAMRVVAGWSIGVSFIVVLSLIWARYA